MRNRIMESALKCIQRKGIICIDGQDIRKESLMWQRNTNIIISPVKSDLSPK